MNCYFKVEIKVESETASGKPKTVRENYLVNAIDFKEAIDIVKEEMRGRGENWEIDRINKPKLTAILNYSGIRDKEISREGVVDTQLT